MFISICLGILNDLLQLTPIWTYSSGRFHNETPVVLTESLITAVKLLFPRDRILKRTRRNGVSMEVVDSRGESDQLARADEMTVTSAMTR